MLHGEGRDVAGRILDKLVEYTVGHFQREEKIWTDGGLASLTEHKKVHAALVKQVADFHSGRATLSADLMVFLRNWLINHVFRSDKVGVKEITERANAARNAK